MENRKFAEGYEVRQKPKMLPENPEVARMLEGPRMWASFFDGLVYDYINGTEMTPETIGANEDAFAEYHQWMITRFDTTHRLIHKNAVEESDNQKYLTEMNFHVMAHPAVYLFEQLIRDDAPLQDSRLRDIQTELAMQAATIQRQRKILKFQEDAHGTQSGVVGVYNGQLTEIDTLITLIEVMKMDKARQLIAVPAPAMFDSSLRSSANADFLLIDKVVHQARGIQSKTRISVSNEALVKYHDDRITLVDGMDDLGNSVPGKYRPGVGVRAAAMPGLIAMDHLQGLTLKDVPHHNDPQTKMEFMRAKGIARELSGGRKSFIPKAVENIKGKVLHDLYLGPSEPTDKFRNLYVPPKEDIVS